MKTINSGGIEAGTATTNGHNGDDPFNAPSGAGDAGADTYFNGEAPHDTAATAVPWLMVADRRDWEPGEEIKPHLTAAEWEAVRTFARRYGVRIVAPNEATEREGTRFEELDALPADLAAVLCPELEGVTRAEVADFINDMVLRDIAEPEAALAKLTEAAEARKRERTQQHQALKDVQVAPDTVVTIPPDTEYALAEVERVAGAQAADAARLAIDRANLLAWGTRGAHRYDEHTTILTAGELVSLRVPATDIAAMEPATADDRYAALKHLEVARQRHRNEINRQAKAPADDGAPLAVRFRLAKDMTYDEPTGTIVSGLLYERTVTHWIGDGNTFKTFTVLGLACSVASGRDFTHQLAVPHKLPVLYLCGESRRYGLGGDLEAWCQYHRFDIDQLELYGDDDVVQLADTARMEELTAFVIERGIKLVVVDTQSKATRGLSENDATDMGAALGNLAALTKAANAAALVIHHTARNTDHGRGSSVWYDDTDTTVLQKSRDRLTAEFGVLKQKSSASGAGSGRVYPVELVPVTVTRTADDGDGIAVASQCFTTLVAVGRDPMSDAERAQRKHNDMAPEDKLLLAVVNDAGAAGITLADAVAKAQSEGYTKSTATARRALKDLTDDGLIAMPKSHPQLFAPLPGEAAAGAPIDATTTVATA